MVNQTTEEVDFQQHSRLFLQWLQSHDGLRINSKIELADLRIRGAGRGVVALEDLHPGEELFFIPHSAVMSIQTSDLKKHLPEIIGLEPWPQIVLVMLYEYGKGKASRWWPYWEVLPESFNTLLYWSDAELKELDGSSVLDKFSRKTIAEFVKKNARPLVTRYPKIFGLDGLSSQGIQNALMPLVARMGTLVMAYAFDIQLEESPDDPDENGYVPFEIADSPKGMVPLADMLNADGERRNNARLEQDEEGFSMIAIKHIGKGEEAFNDYGNSPRSDLLRRYGFVSDEYKANDVVEISLSHIAKVISEERGMPIAEVQSRCEGDCLGLRDRINEMIQNVTGVEDSQILDHSYDIPSPLNKGGEKMHYFEPALILTVEALAMDESEAMRLAKMKHPPFEPASDKTIQLLLAIVNERMKQYATTLASDKELLRAKDKMAIRHRQAVEVRLGEKEILAHAAQYLRAKASEEMDCGRSDSMLDIRTGGHGSKKQKQ